MNMFDKPVIQNSIFRYLYYHTNIRGGEENETYSDEIFDFYFIQDNRSINRSLLFKALSYKDSLTKLPLYFLFLNLTKESDLFEASKRSIKLLIHKESNISFTDSDSIILSYEDTVITCDKSSNHLILEINNNTHKCSYINVQLSIHYCKNNFLLDTLVVIEILYNNIMCLLKNRLKFRKQFNSSLSDKQYLRITYAKHLVTLEHLKLYLRHENLEKLNSQFVIYYIEQLLNSLQFTTHAFGAFGLTKASELPTLSEQAHQLYKNTVLFEKYFNE